MYGHKIDIRNLPYKLKRAAWFIQGIKHCSEISGGNSTGLACGFETLGL